MKDALGHGSGPHGGSHIAGGHLPVWYHGSPTGFPGPTGQIHLGTMAQARIALEARIGVPADGQGWTGNREYGKTLLAGQDTLERLKASGTYVNKYPASGHNSGPDVPKEDYYPTQRARIPVMGRDQTPVSMTMRPAVRAYQISGPMGNRTDTPYSDTQANRLANAQQTRGNGKNGFYYKNEGEGEGVSAVVPNRNHLSGMMG